MNIIKSWREKCKKRKKKKNPVEQYGLELLFTEKIRENTKEEAWKKKNYYLLPVQVIVLADLLSENVSQTSFI